jgi:hypothetical protein
VASVDRHDGALPNETERRRYGPSIGLNEADPMYETFNERSEEFIHFVSCRETALLPDYHFNSPHAP